MIKVEPALDACVQEIGGVRVNDLIGSSPGFPNADYLFREYEVVAELKCLEEDKIADINIINKATEVYKKYMEYHKDKSSGCGSKRITTAGFPESFKYEIAELYRKPIHVAIKNANKQIKETKKNLRLAGYHGLLIVCNERHTALEPALAMWVFSETFRRYGFGSINSILYLTANLKAEHPNIDQDVFVWIPSHIKSERRCPDQLLDRLRRSWFKRVSALSGDLVFEYISKDVDGLNSISNK